MTKRTNTSFFKRYWISAAALLVAITSVSSQDMENDKLHSDHDDKPSYQYPAGSRYDDRFKVVGTSFLGRLQQDGKGKLLEINFDIMNRTSKTINMRMFILGMYEEDTTFTKHRTYVDYPHWRKQDIEGVSRHVTRFSIVPALDKKVVHEFIQNHRKEENDSGEEGHLDDHGSFPMTKNEARKKESLYHWSEYYKFIQENGKKGVPLKLQGGGQGGKDKIIEGERYSIAEYVRRTTVYAQLTIPIQDPRGMYNVVGIYLIDDDHDSIVYQRYYEFKKPLKIH